MIIFLVEDALLIRERLRELIHEAGSIVVGEAITETDALLGIRETQPDLAVVDLCLAEGSGLEVIRQIKLESPNTIIVVMTDFSHELYRRACMVLGAHYYFSKTTEFLLFKQLIEKLTHAFN